MNAPSKVYNIYYEPVIDSVIMDWTGYATSREFREGTELMLKELIENNTYKVLANAKEMTIIALEDQEWLNTEFLPRSFKAGLRGVAVVKPDSYFNKVALETISYRMDKRKIAISFFDSLREAKEWLSLLPNSN